MQAFQIINDYIEINNHNIILSINKKSFNDNLTNAINYNFLYLPNIINIKERNNEIYSEEGVINIGCFGSLRLLKNQNFQALCSINAANKLNKKLRFHITIDIDQDINKNPVFKNLVNLFTNSKHELVT
jgi:hypothetical protein